MLVESILFVGGLVATMVVGIPVAVGLAAPHRWRPLTPVDPTTGRERGGHTAAFIPLDLGPDPVKWPSEKGWSSSNEPELDWPSKSWDDQHFGAHWRDGTTVEVSDLGFHAMAGRRYDSTVSQEEEIAQHQQRMEIKRVPGGGPDRSLQRQRAQAQRERQLAVGAEDAMRRQQEIALDQARRDAHAAASSLATASTPRRAPTREVAKPQARPQAPQTQLQTQIKTPSREELEALIAKVGLAGTVQAIMDRTGWDFRQAAHYLAKIRQGSR